MAPHVLCGSPATIMSAMPPPLSPVCTKRCENQTGLMISLEISDFLQLRDGVASGNVKFQRGNLMPDQAARNLRDNAHRVALQIDRIKALEDAGRLSDARRARETLATITETRDALRLRLKVVKEVAAAEA